MSPLSRPSPVRARRLRGWCGLLIGGSLLAGASACGVVQHADPFRNPATGGSRLVEEAQPPTAACPWLGDGVFGIRFHAVACAVRVSLHRVQVAADAAHAPASPPAAGGRDVVLWEAGR